MLSGEQERPRANEPPLGIVGSGFPEVNGSGRSSGWFMVVVCPVAPDQDDGRITSAVMSADPDSNRTRSGSLYTCIFVHGFAPPRLTDLQVVACPPSHAAAITPVSPGCPPYHKDGLQAPSRPEVNMPVQRPLGLILNFEPARIPPTLLRHCGLAITGPGER
jgi:hypothetical protein